VKHIIRLIVALLTFSTGVGLDRLLSSKPTRVEKAPPTVSNQPISFVAAEPVLPAPLSTPKALLIFDYDTEKFWPEGSYEIAGKRPKGFAKSDNLYIQIWKEDASHVHLLFSIFDDRDNNDLPASFALVTERRLFFVTQPSSDGFVYRFDGEFLRRGSFSDAPEGKAVLKGTLTKSRDNRTVAEWPMKFAVAHDGC